MTQTLTIIRPDDWHLHVRDGAVLTGTVPATAEVFHRAIIMPNLTPPVMTYEDAASYRERILAAVPAGASFHPLMVLYRSEEHTSELQSRFDLVCRLLLEKKNKI